MDAQQLHELALKCDIKKVANQVSIETLDLLKTAISTSLAEMSPEEQWAYMVNINTDHDFTRDAEKLIRAGFASEAELVLMSIATKAANPDPAICKLAELYESQSAHGKTASFTEYLIRGRGPTPEAVYQLAFSLHALGRSDEALEQLLVPYTLSPTPRISRLVGLCLKSIGMTHDAIDVLADTIEADPRDVYSIRALAEIYVFAGAYQKSLDILHMIPDDLVEDIDQIAEALAYRFMGQTEDSIKLLQRVINESSSPLDALWPQCFTYSFAGKEYAMDLLKTCRLYWSISGYEEPEEADETAPKPSARNHPLRIGFLTSDIGEHVVSRFLAPILREHDRDKYYIVLLSTARRFEDKAVEIVRDADAFISIQQLSLAEARTCIKDVKLDVIIDTNGFTRNSGLPILGKRCAPIQCHYIGYHATTGLRTIDYFIGDSTTAPAQFQTQYTEKLIQIPNLWMAYDLSIEFPKAISKTEREGPVFGSYSQVTKINRTTLEYWAAAMNEVPYSVLVIKDRGIQCPTTCQRIETTLEELGVDPSRVYLFGPVGLHLDHLDAYNAIDIALDTTPWSSATTAFEALGMGVPLVAICGETTSSRMSSSVVSSAGHSHWIAHSKEDFARIASELANDYKQIRLQKTAMQEEIRNGILFDEKRIRHDFYATIEKLVMHHHGLD